MADIRDVARGVFNKPIPKVPLAEMTDRVMQRYDRNKNGKIELTGNKNAYRVSEMPESQVANTKIGGSPQFTRDQLSLSKLFTKADANKDNEVTRDEIARLVKPFDTNQDGALDRSELKQISRDFPEKATRDYVRLRGKEIPKEHTFVYDDPGHDRKELSTSVFDLQHRQGEDLSDRHTWARGAYRFGQSI